jgi:branched-chain amino acid transport system substrate-binding protein
MFTRRFIFWIAILALLFFNSGCASLAGTPTPAPTPTATSTGVYACTDSIGCVTIAPSDPIHIAYLLVVSGDASSYGIEGRNGVEIAIDDTGGKILGHAIKFDGENGGCDSVISKAAGEKLASDSTIVAVIGATCTNEDLAAEPLLSKAGFVTISPSDTEADLTDPTNPNHYPGYFRTIYNYKVQSVAAADYAYNILKITKAAIIQDNSEPYFVNMSQVFADNFQKMGGTITKQASIDAAGVWSALADIATEKPDLIYFPINPDAGALVIHEAKNTPGLENAKLMSAEIMDSQEVMNAGGADIEGFMVANKVIQGAAYDAFLAKYKTKFSILPLSNINAYSYDAFNIIKAAVEKVAVKDADGTLHIPRQALRDAVTATANFNGLTGVLTCSASGDCASPVVGIYVYHAGQYPPELIWPKK